MPGSRPPPPRRSRSRLKSRPPAARDKSRSGQSGSTAKNGPNAAPWRRLSGRAPASPPSSSPSSLASSSSPGAEARRPLQRRPRSRPIPGSVARPRSSRSNISATDHGVAINPLFVRTRSRRQRAGGIPDQRQERRFLGPQPRHRRPGRPVRHERRLDDHRPEQLEQPTSHLGRRHGGRSM